MGTISAWGWTDKIFNIQWINSSYVGFNWDGTTTTRTSAIPTTGCNVLFSIGDVNSSYGGLTLSIDYVRVSKTTSTEPTISSWGTEESL